MNNRQKQILQKLSLAKGPVTSMEMAKELQVSSRTIKSDMLVIAGEMEKNGANLISRQNNGYSIQILDEDAFGLMWTLNNLKLGTANFMDGEDRSLYIARKLVASAQGVRIDELAEEMYLTRGALREYMKKAIRFCESFRLQTISAPRQGLRVVGEEHHIRCAMTELFEMHFHRARLDSVGREYMQWVDCDYQERQDIRHVFLKVLRKSGYAMRDSITQRIAMYLIISRNRRRAGFLLELPKEQIKELHGTPLYRVAGQIYEELARDFMDYQVDETETVFLAIYMLSNLDVCLRRSCGQALPFLYPQVQRTVRSMLERVKERTGTDLAGLPDGREMLEQIVFPMTAGVRYGLDGRSYFDWSTEDVYLSLPLEAYFARILAETFANEAGGVISCLDLSVLSCYVLGVLSQVQYPVKRLRLLVTNAISSEFGRLAAEGLRQRYPDLVESVRDIELYEARGIPETEYDAILVGHAREPAVLYGYNYDAPAATILSFKRGGDYGYIYNQLLVKAYRTDELIFNTEEVHVYEDFLFYDPEQAFQFLSARYARGSDCMETLCEIMRRQNEQLSLAIKDCVFIFGESSLCRENCFDLYHLKKRKNWGGAKVNWLLFISFPMGDMPRLRAMSAVLSGIVEDSNVLEQIAARPFETMQELFLKSVRLYV